MGQSLTSCFEEVKPPEIDSQWDASYKLPLGAPPAGSTREANPMVFFDITIGDNYAFYLCPVGYHINTCCL